MTCLFSLEVDECLYLRRTSYAYAALLMQCVHPYRCAFVDFCGGVAQHHSVYTNVRACSGPGQLHRPVGLAPWTMVRGLNYE